jgi:hypothetical protein
VCIRVQRDEAAAKWHGAEQDGSGVTTRRSNCSQLRYRYLWFDVSGSTNRRRMPTSISAQHVRRRDQDLRYLAQFLALVACDFLETLECGTFVNAELFHQQPFGSLDDLAFFQSVDQGRIFSLQRLKLLEATCHAVETPRVLSCVVDLAVTEASELRCRAVT